MTYGVGSSKLIVDGGRHYYPVEQRVENFPVDYSKAIPYFKFPKPVRGQTVAVVAGSGGDVRLVQTAC